MAVHRRWSVQERLHDPPRLLHSVLAGEPCALTDHRGMEQHLVRSRSFTALVGELHVQMDGARAGRVLASWDLAREYGFTDVDGSQPHWAEHYSRTYGRPYPVADDTAYASWLDSSIEVVKPDWPSY